MKPAPRPQGREAIKAWHRQKIIDATIDVITTHGIAGTTVARVVDLAEVSMGLVNVHFRSKQALLSEVLQQMADRYRTHWRSRLDAAPSEPGARLMALLLADLDPEVLNLKTLGVWFAFRAQVRAKPEYLELAGMREREQMRETIELLSAINRATGKRHDPATLARLLAWTIEGLWAEYYLYPGDFDRDRAIASIDLLLDSVYPGYYEPL
ncbi:MAG: TetR family transcriptional regulator C-terminal domain-containing protein [Gammaproteobacteria bacterium]|nr:MAG: TetR family transcriptional regulator C-terminal domain-containing protein [Gammaproteobacteria bacterium]